MMCVQNDSVKLQRNETMKRINTDTQTIEYNPTGCRGTEQSLILSFQQGKINKNIKLLISECTGSQPIEIDYIYTGSGQYYPVVKCKDNNVYVIDVDLYELSIIREGFTRGELSDLCIHMRNCWSMLGI